MFSDKNFKLKIDDIPMVLHDETSKICGRKFCLKTRSIWTKYMPMKFGLFRIESSNEQRKKEDTTQEGTRKKRKSGKNLDQSSVFPSNCEYQISSSF